MASYAPLFANTEAWQWTPNLIWVNSLGLYATPNYYVQQLFTCNRGDVVLPVKLGDVEKSAAGVQTLYASATRDDNVDEIILKVVNPGTAGEPVEIKLAGCLPAASEVKVSTLAGDNLDQVNSMDRPRQISPVETRFKCAAADFTHTFPPRSMTVLRIKAQ